MKSKLGKNLIINVFFILSFLISLFFLLISWNYPILDEHGFRQTQTAISAYWINKNWKFIDYFTPVLGYPWSIPFELPVYQWIVAVFYRIFPISLDQSGRLVNILFFWGIFFPLNIIFNNMGIEKLYSKFLFSLLLISPFYLFWNRSFMIESTALFFSISYVSIVTIYLKKQNLFLYGLMALTAILSSLIKITTFAPLSLSAACFVIYDIWNNRKHLLNFKRLKVYFMIASTILLSLGILEIWVMHSDNLKTLNPIGKLITSKALFYWNFGTFHQRISQELWRIAFGRAMDQALGSKYIFWIVLVVSIFNKQKIQIIQLMCLFLYISDFLIFTNLLYVHTYYVYANDIFLILFVGIGIIGFMDNYGSKLTVFFILIIVIFFAIEVRNVYLPEIFYSKKATEYTLGRFIKKHTKSNEVIVGFGLDWSSAIPYYAERKAIFFPSWYHSFPNAFNFSQMTYRSSKIGSVILCGDKIPNSGSIFIKNFKKITKNASDSMEKFNINGCSIFIRKSSNNNLKTPFNKGHD